MRKVLFVVDDHRLRNLLRHYFRRNDKIKAKVTHSLELAGEYLNKDKSFELIVLSFDTEDGIHFVKNLRDTGNWIPACLYTNIPMDTISNIMQGQNCIKIIPKTDGFPMLTDQINRALYLVSTEVVQRLTAQNLIVQDLVQNMQKVLLTL